MDIVYFYIHSESGFNELKYSIQSVRKNFTSKHRIVIIGDMPVDVDMTDILHIPTKHIQGFKGCRLHDISAKTELLMNHADISDEFVLMMDDIYFVKPINITWLRKNIISNGMINLTFTGSTASQIWQGYLRNTHRVLTENDCSTINFENHLPMLFRKDLLKAVYTRFKPLQNELLHHTLYGNIYYGNKQTTHISKENRIKAGFYGVDNSKSYNANLPVNELKALILEHQFLNHDDRGLSQNLKKAIMEIMN